MARRVVIGIAVLVAAVSGGIIAFADEAPTPPDLTGNWKLDPAHSTMPQRPEGGGPHGDRAGGHGWGGGGGWSGGGSGGWSGGTGHHGGGMGHRHGGEGGEAGGGGGGEGKGDRGARNGARPPRLPDVMHITETATIVSFEDSTGAVVMEIATVPPDADTLAQAPGAQHMVGGWKGDKLIVTRDGPNDSKMTETIALTDKGQSLVVETKVESNNDSPPRDFKRVYKKVASDS
jgi:hypothetical protein